MNWFSNLFLFGSERPKNERYYVREFLRDPQTGYKPLAEYLWTQSPDFNTKHRQSWSLSKGISVYDDIYGYEVKVGGIDYLLDCAPSAYGLKKEQAEELYAAILSCVPGSIYHRNKIEARIDGVEPDRTGGL